MQQLNYTALEPVRIGRPVDRLSFLEAQVKGKRIFDLGALDETAYTKKRNSNHWLHARLARSADFVIGIDNSPLVPVEGLTTSENSRIINANIFDLAPTVEQYGVPDAIVAGELIEHIDGTLGLLKAIARVDALNDVPLVFSTPNACCWHNALIGLMGRESMHPDHLQIYSYKTLSTLFARAGYRVQAITPYHARFPEMIESSSGLASMATRAFQTTVNVLETLTPLLSGGWIVQASPGRRADA
ncbi:hypothetical protein J2X02_000783 [Pseudoxanthomonas japonensis]|uniref:methyltransferase domain-containing protein n=1 Tax=Pseudoxanthomonas japonensis TaxID=69284 RepID=UPI0028550B3F|nr:methyltransferase domain-containing protein [Pseudoxanthomonas japonensis]MDR7067966.1 hypothetical protein [Pseudoxanthomonas japonensis]